MKGLLIKDFKLLLGQKRFFVIVIGMGVMLMFSSGETTSAIGYITMLLMIFTLNTLSYDEHENGMNFLLTLPVARKTYVQEKFVFAGLLGLGSGIISIALSVIVATVRELPVDPLVATVVAGAVLGMSFFLLAIMLPIEIKFGAEKGRMAMFAVFAVIGVSIGVGVKIAEKMGADVERIMLKLSVVSPVTILFVAVFALILVLLASYLVSVRIINKKEY